MRRFVVGIDDHIVHRAAQLVRVLEPAVFQPSMNGDQIKQLHHAGGINLRVAAIARANGTRPVAQIHECDGDLIGLELLAGVCCERLVDGFVHESL